MRRQRHEAAPKLRRERRALVFLTLPLLWACGGDPAPTEIVDTPVSISTTSLPQAVVNLVYSASLAAAGGDGSFAWSLASGTLPSGLDLSAAGTISGTPSATGTATFVARATSGSDSDEQALSIDVAPATSATTLFSEGFDDANAAARGWFDNTSFTIDQSEQVAGSASLALHFSPGATTPDFGGTARVNFTETESVYVSYWVKYSPNWAGSGQSDHPHELYLLTTEDSEWVGPSFTHLTTYIEHNYQSGLVPRLGVQDASNIDQGQIGVDLTGTSESRSVAGCNGNSDGFPTDCYNQGGGTHNNGKFWNASQPALTDQPGPAYKGDWHHIEVYLRLNTIQGGIGQLDGVGQYWVDGALVIDAQNVLFRTGANASMKFRTLLIGPYIGAGSPVDQTAWIDELRIADGR